MKNLKHIFSIFVVVFSSFTEIEQETLPENGNIIRMLSFNILHGATTKVDFKWGSTYNKNNPKPTFPSNSPEVKIDYNMFYSRNRWKALGTKAICDSIASGLCAYLVVLELLPKK